jgi:hypothetical protein
MKNQTDTQTIDALRTENEILKQFIRLLGRITPQEKKQEIVHQFIQETGVLNYE